MTNRAIRGLTSLAGSTISFFTAFGLEVLLYSDKLWTRVPVGTLLAMVIFLICWCVWVVLESKTHFSLLSGLWNVKNGLVAFTGRGRGMGAEPDSGAVDVEPDSDAVDARAVDAGGGDGRGKARTHSRSGTLKEVFGRLRPRRLKASMTTSVDQTEGSAGGPLDVTLEMGKINRDMSGGAA